MQAIYGSRWTASLDGIEETAVREWVKGLQGLSAEKIRDGLTQCQRGGSGWPPSLPEFRAMCEGRAVNGFGLDYTPEVYRERRAERLLDAPRNEELAQTSLADMKKILKGGDR